MGNEFSSCEPIKSGPLSPMSAYGCLLRQEQKSEDRSVMLTAASNRLCDLGQIISLVTVNSAGQDCVYAAPSTMVL